MLNQRTLNRPAVFMPVALLLTALGVIGLAALLLPSSAANGLADSPTRYDWTVVDQIGAYRSHWGTCFDAAIGERAGCLRAVRQPVYSFRSRADGCFDVPVGDAAACRRAGLIGVPSYRAPNDVCYDVSIGELAACRQAE
jgi:hypothetical protein